LPEATPAQSLDGFRRKGELTAERILDAAEALFAERGYAGTTLRDVAARVGLRIPSLYNHFPSKDALYAAVLERGIGPVLQILGAFSEGARRDRSEVIAEVMELLQRHPNLPRLVVHETLSGGQRLTPMLRTWIEPIFGRAGEMVAESPSGGRWTAEQIPLLVLAMYHMMVGYFASASLWADLNGTDLLSPAMFAQQTALLREIVAALFPDEPATNPS
jgi:AcrR family transcriptional regulator